MENIQTLEYKATPQMTSAIKAGREFIITSGKQKYIAYPYSTDKAFTQQEHLEIKQALDQSKKDFASGNFISHDEMLAKMDAVLANYK